MNRSRLTNLLFFCFFACSSFVSTRLQGQQSPRKKISFDTDWKFHLGHAADATKDFNYGIATIFSKTGKAESTPIDSKFDDSSWRAVQVPHDWAVELPFENSKNEDVMAHGYKPVGGLFPQNSIGWYRKAFVVAKVDSGQRFAIQFDGVFRNSKVWLNGFYLGTNESGYVGFTYDVTDYINFNKKNVLVVRVDASQYEGWFYEGAGIYRHVWLNQFDNLNIAHDGMFVYTKVQDKEATVTIETTVENQSLSPAVGTLHSFVTDRNGKVLAQSNEKSISMSVNETQTIKQELVLKDAKLWSLEDPYLYKIVSVIKSGNKIADAQSIRFGVRTVVIDKENGLLLNGKSVKVQGVNCHQDHAGVGSALPDYLQYYRIRMLKDLGVNAYRTSHNMPTAELLDACDSLGMLVLDENRLLNSSPEYLSQFKRLIIRDRSRACVFLWSIANEEGYVQKNSFGKRIAQSLLAVQKTLDPTRISTYAADVGNVYAGINEVIPVRGFNYREKFVVPYHNDHPNQPVIGTEMGSTVTTRGIYAKDSIHGYVPDQDITAPWWASTAEAWWPTAAVNKWYMGGFVWTGFDYRGEPTPFKWPNISSHFGIMDVCGFPKNIYYYYQSWWTDKDVLHISPHWNWKGKEGQNIDVWVNSNADNVELFLNGKSLGKKDMLRNSHLNWTVPYQPGTLEAVAYKKGKKISASVETTDAPNKIVMVVDRNTLTADGKDATVINITSLDKKGREVPDANNLIQFTINGNGKIIGAGNGDPSGHESDEFKEGHYQYSLFNGKCQLIIQTLDSPGTVTIEAKSAGLVSATASIQVVK